MIIVLFAIILALFLFGLAIPFSVLGIWNLLLVDLFNVHTIDYLQALGMMYIVSLVIGIIRVWNNLVNKHGK